MQTKRNLYDAYVNDSDLIGTHSRLQLAYNLTDFMAGEGKDVTSPTLDINDFMGVQFTTGPDGDLYQLPDQQFANLTGSARIGLIDQSYKQPSKRSMATILVFQSTGLLTKILLSSSRMM